MMWVALPILENACYLSFHFYYMRLLIFIFWAELEPSDTIQKSRPESHMHHCRVAKQREQPAGLSCVEKMSIPTLFHDKRQVFSTKEMWAEFFVVSGKPSSHIAHSPA